MWLNKILKYKKEELERTMRRVRLGDVKRKVVDAEPARDFMAALKTVDFGFVPAGPAGWQPFELRHGRSQRADQPPPSRTDVKIDSSNREQDRVRIIAEMKKASPSGGLICPKYDPAGIAEIYQENGAAALSVLTDAHFFQGSLKHLSEVHQAVKLPILRKDFTFHEYQLYEARGALADAVLLIVRILDDFQVKDYLALAGDLGMASLVEVHDEKEIERTARLSAKIIGINNRDLETLKTDLSVTERLAPKAPVGSLLVSESGISSKKEIERIQKVGVNCFLIGESLLRDKNSGLKLKELISSPSPLVGEGRGEGEKWS